MPESAKRLLILASKLGYQTRSFADAARALSVEVLFGTDRCHRLDDPWADSAIPLHFEEPEHAARDLVAQLASNRPHALLALGDRPTATAAFAARAFGLTYSSPEATLNCRSKLRQREVLRHAHLPVPDFFSFALDESLDAVIARGNFPCVVKPLMLAASQGVIRANNPAEFAAAVTRLRALLESPEVQVTREPALDRLLVERYIPGKEFAVEGLLDRGKLRVLAIFDKPDLLEGPYFEETIYVTPSRLSEKAQAGIAHCLEESVRALGLEHGPLHAEFRVNDAGVWVLEVQPRPIGGLCARALRFGPEKIFLEELLVRHALGLPGSELPREAEASGVMMIPVSASGVLDAVEGVEEARATPNVTDIQITARLHDPIVAWPEGASYLGFIFARAERPEEVEAALPAAHARLQFRITPRLPVEHPVTRKVPAAGA